ncbi:MAG: bifunctional oligoribonuclease/PAP phosphatase NrnA [Candidatus Eisenbacteria sp.]|nr:bifunctional oligoribonuclease/PAP phosphatase NrnA [Candidatus Eisenbacteria bacterium]
MEWLDQLAQQLLDARRILITTHHNPDGDGIGCLLAMRDALATQEQAISLVTPGEIPARFRFLPGSRDVLDWTVLGEQDRERLLASQDLILVLDTHEHYMLGALGDALQQAGIRTLFLDHHPFKSTPREGIYCDPNVSSTGELCRHLIAKLLRKPMSPVAATCLYVAITYDTNSFKYLRRRPETLRVAAELVEMGADTDEIYRHIFASKSPAKIELTRDLLEQFHLEDGGRVAWSAIDSDLIQRTRATADDMRDLITQLLEMEGVEIAITFKERGPDRFKVSLRSKGRFPLDEVTEKLGGGGHRLASGAHVDGSLDQVTARVLSLVQDLITKAS